MAKIIIDNQSSISDSLALVYVTKVINMGKVSNSHKGKQYCFVTVWDDDNIVIYADKNKKSDKFTIFDRKGDKNER